MEQQPQSLSRYRTVRRAQASNAHNDSADSVEAGANTVDIRPAPPAPVVASVGRTASRYRKAGLSSSANEPSIPVPSTSNLPSPPEQPSRYHRTTEQYAISGRPATAIAENSGIPQAYIPTASTSRQVSGNASTLLTEGDNAPYRPSARPDGHAAMVHERLRRGHQDHTSPPGPGLSRSIDANNRKRIDSHGQTDEEDGSRLTRHTSQPHNSHSQSGMAAQSTSRKPSVHQHRSTSNPVQSQTRRDPSATPAHRQWHDAPVTLTQGPAVPEKPVEEVTTIKPGGGGIVPGTDAPQSAVNSGERRVLLTFNNSSMQFPVTLDTTPLQLLRSAANCFSEHFEPRSATLTEVYSKANVQRPLRMYEHVRDVMNSWDDDSQHTLVIESSTLDANNELFATFAPKERPTGGSWTMYHSQKPGKWEKRTITLNAEGQLSWSKLDGKDPTRICHFDDFDVYTVMSRRIRKVKPPKKHCFAIKSQEKSTVFMDTSTFIQFFSTNDGKTAHDFFRTIQDWRSWYLVDVLGEGKKKPKEKPAPIQTKAAATKKTLEAPPLTGQSSKSSSSADSHYLLGTFNNLGLDADNFVMKTPPKHRRGSSDDVPLALAFPNAPMTRAATVHKRIGDRLVLASNRTQPRRDDNRTASDSDDVFARRGRRARGPTDQLQQQRPTTSHPQNAAITRSGTVRRSPDLPQSGSDQERGPKPRPLIDLTPAYIAPKQHQKKGKGHYPENLGPGNLIEAATTPENPIDIPASRDWRGANAALAPPNSAPLPASSGGIARSASVRKYSPPNTSTEATFPQSQQEAAGFTDHSLLASMVQTGKEGWGAGWGGHGVKRSDTVKHVGGDKPLLDINEGSRFAQGSLVQGLEKKGHVGQDAV